nr:hypothetical protein [Tanacetum cinerariifolium]
MGHENETLLGAYRLSYMGKGNGPIQVSTYTNGQIRVLPPKTAEEILARERERKARTTLLMAIPEEHLAKFHKMTDAKVMWEAIKSRFGGNDESKKMQKYLQKQQFKSFSVSNSEGLHKGYGRFKSLLSQLETHGVGSLLKMPIKSFLGLYLLSGPNGPQLDHEDLEQVDEFDLEEMDLKWKMAMISTSLKKFYKKTGRKLHFDAKEPVGFDKSRVENSGSDTEVTTCLKVCEESYAKLKKLYDEQREQLGVASIEIQAYTLALKKVEAQLVCHQNNQLAYEEKISQMSAKDKSWLGYGSQIHDEILSYENEVFASVFDSRSSDVEDNHVNDRFAKVEGMHAVPPPMTGNYMPRKSDFGIDESKFTYGPKQFTTSESDAKTNDIDSFVNKPKVWNDAPIIEEYESDNDDEHVTIPSKEQEKPSFAFVNTVEHVKTPRQIAKEQNICSQNPNPSKIDWNGLKSKRIASTSTARKVNTAKLKVNEIRPRHNVYKSHSPIRRPFNRTTATKPNFAQHEVNTARDKSVSADGANRKLLLRPQQTLKGKGIVDSGCSRHMTGNKAYLVDYQDFNGGPVAFGGTKCLVLSPDFKLPDENQVLLRVPRQHNMYNFNLNNIVPFRGLACLITKVTVDESTKWHRSKAFRVYNLETKRVEENLHINFLENKPNVAEKGPTWLFDLDYLTGSMNYQPITVENKANKTTDPKETNNSTSTQDSFDTRNSKMEAYHTQEYYVLPLWSSYTSTVKSSKTKNGDKKLNEDTDSKKNKEQVDREDQAFLEELERLKRQEKEANDVVETLRKTFAQSNKDLLLQASTARASSTNYVNTASTPVNAASTPLNTSSIPTNHDDYQIPSLKDIYEVSKDGIFTSASYDDEGTVADFTNLESIMNRRNNHKDLKHCLFTCFLSQNEHKKISQALEDESWVDAMQEGLLQFKIQKVWILVDLPFRKKAIRTKWVYKNKKDERGVVVRNKARLVAHGHRQEEWINYDEVFSPVAKIEAIRIFLAFAFYMGFIVYQMDMKSAILYGKIDEEVYRKGLIDKTLFIKKDKKDIIQVQVYVDDIIFGSTKKSWCDKFKALMKNKDKYFAEILKKFDFLSVNTASTPIVTKKPLVKDEKAADVDVHLYRSMISSLMYLTASRPDIVYAVCACSRFQVTPKTLHLQVMKRIFRFLKGHLKLGLWYPRESVFDLEAYSDSDYARTNLNRKSIIGGCQFISRRLISWQCKKQIVVATSTKEAEYVAAASCYGQVLWIQNQMLDYGFNFMNIKIYIDNKRTICIVKNPVFHSKIKHIEIRHHFIRDAYEKKLI